MYLKLGSNLFAEAFGPQLHSKAWVMLNHMRLQTSGRINRVEIRGIRAIMTHNTKMLRILMVVQGEKPETWSEGTFCDPTKYCFSFRFRRLHHILQLQQTTNLGNADRTEKTDTCLLANVSLQCNGFFVLCLFFRGFINCRDWVIIY